MNKKGFIALFVLVVALVIMSCENEPKINIPDVSDISLDYEVVRFDQIIAQLDTNNLKEEIEFVRAKYPEFTQLFFSRILPFEAANDEEFLLNLRGYLSDERIKKLQDTVSLLFKDIENNELSDLEQSMKYMKYYFDDFNVPNVYTFTSEYTYQKFIFQDKERDGIGIGLDMFLGSDYDYKKIDPKNPAFSEYLTRSFSREHIVKMMMEVLVDDEIGRVPGSRLIDNMIHNGKKLYILERVIPGIPDSILYEYTAEQTEWVNNNELEMWAFFFDENLFYESNSMKINKYISPSPNSPGMPPKAPGKTANYIGHQIVKAYMKKFPKTSIQELIGLMDSQHIMDKSRYKPKRR